MRRTLVGEDRTEEEEDEEEPPAVVGFVGVDGGFEMVVVELREDMVSLQLLLLLGNNESAVSAANARRWVKINKNERRRGR